MSNRLDRFAGAAREFVAWCDSGPVESSAEAAELLRHFVQLYSLALELSLPRDPDLEIEGYATSDAEWRRVSQRCSVLPFNYYSEVFDPQAIPPEEGAVVGDLADDVADVHRDLMSGLSLYEANHPLEAEWQWRSNFNIHWGRHAVSAIRALHCWFEKTRAF